MISGSDRESSSAAKMLAVYLKKHRNMLLCGIFFFYLGCGLTISLLKMDCAEAVMKTTVSADSIVDPHSSVEYAVVILSGLLDSERRDCIRKSWMKLTSNIVTKNGVRVFKWNSIGDDNIQLPDFIRFYFVIGIKHISRHDTMGLVYENQENKDLLLLDNVEEGYLNLSKKMLKTMEWLSKNFKNLKYVIKSDEDSFVRIDLIIRDLEAYGPNLMAPDLAKYVSYKRDIPFTVGLYWGYFNGQAHVYQSGKWEEKEWFQCDNYLPYALGGGYVISQKIVQYIGNNANWLNPYKSEDVSMGLWTAALQGINRVHDIRFDTEWKSRGCQHDMLVRHKQNITEITKMYNMVVATRGKQLCSVVFEARKSYRYNWDVPPSKCCK